MEVNQKKIDIITPPKVSNEEVNYEIMALDNSISINVKSDNKLLVLKVMAVVTLSKMSLQIKIFMCLKF